MQQINQEKKNTQGIGVKNGLGGTKPGEKGRLVLEPSRQ